MNLNVLAGFFFERPKKFERPLKKDVLAVANNAIKSATGIMTRWKNRYGMQQTIRA